MKILIADDEPTARLITEVLEEAEALYRAKKLGRNHVEQAADRAV